MSDGSIIEISRHLILSAICDACRAAVDARKSQAYLCICNVIVKKCSAMSTSKKLSESAHCFLPRSWLRGLVSASAAREGRGIKTTLPPVTQMGTDIPWPNTLLLSGVKRPKK